MEELSKRIKVMIAGVGGASLGTEIYKSLRLAGKYEIYGCDVSSTAYGLYEPGFAGTYRVNRENYVSSVIDACFDAGAKWLIPGGEQSTGLLCEAARRLAEAGVRLLVNAPEVVALFSDKAATFKRLAESGMRIPRTVTVSHDSDLECVGLPCIVKPATGSGGSASVFFAVSFDEAKIYADFIRRTGTMPIVQEYIDADEGEFTIGVLSLPDGTIAGSIALRRVFDAKLSIAYRGRGGLVSSGYSQGYIDEYPEIRRQAERIAVAVGSRGPLNIQGRVCDGVLLPFEINPRFSASTYLRAMAGFNEIDVLLSHLIWGGDPQPPKIQPGWYLRSLIEQYVSGDRVR